jgi:hypothetical protein
MLDAAEREREREAAITEPNKKEKKSTSASR